MSAIGREALRGARIALITCGVAFALTALWLSVFRGNNGNNGAPQPTRPDSTAKTTPASADKIEVSADVSRKKVKSGWHLMADQTVAERTPPKSVTNCRNLYSWALNQGAIPGGTAIAHDVTIQALEKVHLRVESIQVREENRGTPSPSSGGKIAKPARLGCTPHKHDKPPLPEPTEADVEVDTAYHDQVDSIEPTRIGTEFSLNAGGRIDLSVLVNPLYGPWEYKYSITLRVSVNGQDQTAKLDNNGEYFRWIEDGGGMGYIPPSYQWHMIPQREVVHCKELSYAKAPPPQPNCDTFSR